MAIGSGQGAHHQFREVMGRFCTGIAIVTSYDEVGPVGLTCQSVASVSLNPPLVLFCGGKNSTSLPRILATGRFCINILGDDHHEIAQQFAVSGTDKFARGDWRLSAQGMPQLGGAIAHIECTVDLVQPAGDHDIVVGSVSSVEAASAGQPLLFYRSEYRLVGTTLRSQPIAEIAADAHPTLVAWWGRLNRGGASRRRTCRR